jgi:hypothetical protein
MVAQCKRSPLGLIGCVLCCANELKPRSKIAVNARKVNFFKAVLFWVKNKVLVAQIIATSLQNYSRKRKICFSR